MSFQRKMNEGNEVGFHLIVMGVAIHPHGGQGATLVFFQFFVLILLFLLKNLSLIFFYIVPLVNL
jgi:hypothetical protein